MPDFDTGHIFLTTLAPIKKSKSPEDSSSCIHSIREKLASLDTARQSPATCNVRDKSGSNEEWRNSPFASNNRTHLARMFVLEDVVYNGRSGGSALAEVLVNKLVNKKDSLIPEQEDHLNCGYLVFCAEIDAVFEDGAPLPNKLTKAQQVEVRRSYARCLWETMGNDLEELYKNCEGFGVENSAEDFASYLEKCHVNTTMPFHDYFSTEKDKETIESLPTLSSKFLLFGLGLFLVLSAVVHSIFSTGWWSLLVGIVVTGIIGVLYVLKRGEKPWPHAEFDDLPSVLKSLYIQQRFSQFLIDNQGVDNSVLHERFGQFIANYEPGNKFSPTQAPGVISSSIDDGAVIRDEHESE